MLKMVQNYRSVDYLSGLKWYEDVYPLRLGRCYS